MLVSFGSVVRSGGPGYSCLSLTAYELRLRTIAP